MQADASANGIFPRQILLAVAANSPQIVTETFFALAHLANPVWIPTEIHIITTQRGAGFVRCAFLNNENNHLQNLCNDYSLPYPLFGEQNIHVICDDQGQPLEDVRSRVDNVFAADFITQIVREFTADPASSLHVSLAGGRRTMTYYIGYALSLFGRIQDRLSHVVVDSEYFFNQAFYYPPPKPIWVVRDDGSGFDASQVEVTLAEIPFLRLREGLPEPLLQGNASFSSTIAAAQQCFDPPEVRLNWRTATLICGNIAVTMPPVQFAFYAWMLQRRVQNLPPVHWTDQETPTLATQFLHIYVSLFGKTGGYVIVKRTLNDGMNKTWFDERKSHTNKELKKYLGEQLATPYLLQTTGKRPRMRCGVSLPSEAVSLL